MKFVLLVFGALIGYGAHALIDLRSDYARAVKLAEAHCVNVALAMPEVVPDPSKIKCKLIIDDDFVLTFEVNEIDGILMDCLPSAVFFRREVQPRECKLYER